jgi:hypothetical protein
MAQINTYQERVLPQGGMNVQADGNAFGANVGQAVSNVGSAVMEYASSQNKIQQDEGQLWGYNKAGEAYLGLKKQFDEQVNSLDPNSPDFSQQVNTLTDRFKEEIDNQTASIAQEAPNHYAAKAFTTHMATNSKSLLGSAITEEARLRGAYTGQQIEQGIRQDQDAIIANPNEYERVVTNRVNSIGQFKSIDPAEKMKWISKSKENLAATAVEGSFARDIYGAAKKLLPNQVNEAYSGAASGDSAAGFVDKVFGALITKESDGVHIKDGKLLTSDAGALGITQVMPATGTDPGYGVAPLKNQSKEEYIRFGRDYLTAMYKEFNGDASKALAAYNAGPGTVKDAVAAFGNDWLSKMPLETQGYVAKLSPFANTDSQGQLLPQLKLSKVATLAPPQTADIPGWNDLSLESQHKFMAKLVTDFNSRVGVDRATLKDDRDNMTANLLSGNNYDNKAAVQARYVQAYGPEMAQRMIAEDKNNEMLGLFTKGIRGQTMAEITAMMGPPPGDNATASDYETRRKMEAAVTADREALKKDPVAYVAQYSLPVKQAALTAQAARNAAESDPSPAAQDAARSATQRMIASSLAEQRRLGIANPEILSKDQEKQLADEIDRISGSGQNVAQGIDALYKSYGAYGPTVAAQMAPKVGGLMNVLGSGIDPTTGAALVEASRNKEAYKKTLPDEKLKDLDVAIQTVMAPYSVSLAGVPNSGTVQANYQEQISSLAMYRMSKLGESQGDAVQKAFNALVGNQYKFQDGYRVPVNLDAKAIQRQASSTISNLKASDVALLPGSLGNPEDRMQAQLSSIRAYGRWVTTSQIGTDGKLQEGLTLMIPTPGGFQAVPDAQGKPLFRSFGEMLVDYQTSGIQTSQDALMRNDMKAYNKLKAQENAAQRNAENQRAQDVGRAYRGGVR